MFAISSGGKTPFSENKPSKNRFAAAITSMGEKGAL